MTVYCVIDIVLLSIDITFVNFRRQLDGYRPILLHVADTDR